MGDGGITMEGISLLKRQLLACRHVDDLHIEGVKPERIGIFPAGLAIVEAVFDALHLASLRHVDGALREGALYDLLGRHQHEDVRERSILA